MNAVIPVPRIGRRQSIANPIIQPLSQGEFVNAVHYIWSKFNVQGGINLSGFRHNCREFYDENTGITPYEQNYIRGLLSDPDLQICVSPAGNSFRWDTRTSTADRKIIFIDEVIFILFSNIQNEAQNNAIRLIFMATLIHCLGDYITMWAQPNVDFSTNTRVHRFEGGTKTEYAFFGGIIGGHQAPDGIHFECTKLRLFNPQNQVEHYFIPDHIAREYYVSDYIRKFTEVGLTKNAMATTATNSIRQLDICCGWHRLVWKPVRPPQNEQQPPFYPPPGYYSQGAPGTQGSSWYPPLQQPQQQTSFPSSYGPAPGTYAPGTYAPSTGNFNNTQPISYPPSLGISTSI